MPSQVLQCEKFLGLTENPLYSQKRGVLRSCQNFRVTPDGMLEGRGGTEKFLPTGGTANAPIAGGFYTGAHEHAMPVCTVMRRSSAAAFTNNLSLQAYYDYFSDTAVGTRLYFVAPQKFSRILLNIGRLGAGGYTVLWKYLDTGGAAQTLTGVSEDFKTATGNRTLTWIPPSDWGKNAVNNVYGYVVYAEIATAVLGTIPTQSTQRVFVNWQGQKDLYLGSSNNAAAVNNGTVSLHGLTNSASFTSNITTTLTSTGDPRIRFASWRGYLYFLNGFEQKRYNLDTVSDFGYTSPAGALTTAVGATGLTGIFRYGVTYGYGAAGELGESGVFYQTDADRAPVNQAVTVTLSGLTGVPAKGIADVIYLYRSVDLSTVTLATSYGAFPFYRVATVTRQADGTFPASVTDSTMAVPIPAKTLNPVSVAPPSNCRHIAVHRSRMFLASNDQYPGRVWWSRNFEPESFNQDEDFADFTRQTGGIVTAMIEFADQVIVFTEDAMYGIANVDQDPPNVYIIAAGIGCVAADALKAGYGLLMWPSRGGVYIWDGTNPPELVTDDLPITMRNLTVEKHGGTRAIIHNRIYELLFMDNANTTTNLSRYRYAMDSKTWHTVLYATSDLSLGPLVTMTMPLAHEDVGVRHPIFGKAQATGSLFHIYVGEWKNGDDGNAVTYTAQVHFGPSDNKVMSPEALGSYHKGFTVGNITLAFSTLSWIGDTPTLSSTLFHDAASDYTYSGAQIQSMSSYSGDIVAQFSVTGATSGGNAIGKYLIAMYLKGNVTDQPMLRTN